MSVPLTEEEITELQERINRFREARTPSLRPIPVSGKLDKATTEAIRCCQHEHNAFFKTRELHEDGVLDILTRTAMDWWDRIISAMRTPAESS